MCHKTYKKMRVGTATQNQAFPQSAENKGAFSSTIGPFSPRLPGEIKCDIDIDIDTVIVIDMDTA